MRNFLRREGEIHHDLLNARRIDRDRHGLEAILSRFPGSELNKS